MRYFFLVPAGRFHELILPALAASWRHKALAPLVDLVRRKDSAVPATPYLGYEVQSMSLQVPNGIPFRHDLWRIFFAEALISNAIEMPQIETPLCTYAKLLGQELSEDRTTFVPIQRAVLGGRELTAGGGFYRPDAAGWNDSTDVEWLDTWLTQVNTSNWSELSLDMSAEPGDGRSDELQFALEWFPDLCGLYRRAHDIAAVVVTEEL